MNPFYFNSICLDHSRPGVTGQEVERARAGLRQKIVSAIQTTVKQRRMTHTEASFEARMGRTVITNILNGNLQKISTDRLLRIAYRLSLKIELKIVSD
jgi:predicted XRE-type DNA-binding protein